MPIYECQIIQLLLSEEAVIICRNMGRFALTLLEVLRCFMQVTAALGNKTPGTRDLNEKSAEDEFYYDAQPYSNYS